MKHLVVLQSQYENPIEVIIFRGLELAPNCFESADSIDSARSILLDICEKSHIHNIRALLMKYESFDRVEIVYLQGELCAVMQGYHKRN